MATYTVNGKQYTDHALMDEIVYNCKLILDGTIIKNDELALSKETANSMNNFDYYRNFVEGNMTYRVMPLVDSYLKEFGYDYRMIQSFKNNRDNIPEADRQELVDFVKERYVRDFVEENDYYRTLMGLPNYGTNEYNIYLSKSDFPSDYNKEIDLSKPIHEYSDELISILDSTGKMDELISTHSGSRYEYLKFLGQRKIDFYTARKASKWDILYIPSAETLVEDRFIELYLSNRDIYLKRSYSDAFSFSSDYYEQIMILLVLCQTFNDMIVDVPEWYIRRDIFDIRSVQYFLESYGVAFYKEIPLKYQIRIVKSLNKLIKYKASNKNCFDIKDIFAADDVYIYKYYMFKKRLAANKTTYVKGKNDNEKYELEFVATEIGKSYDDYIKDMIYRKRYDDITLADKYWDGEDEHDYIYNQHLNREFTIEGTKYMSIEYDISMEQYLYQMSFFLGLLLDSNLNFDDITIKVPSIQKDTSFKVSDLFLLLILLTSAYYNGDTTKRLPEDFNNRYLPKPPFLPYDDYDGGYADSIDFDNDYNGMYSKDEFFEYRNTDGGYANNNPNKPTFDVDGALGSTLEDDFLNSVLDYDDNKMLQGSDVGNNIHYLWLEADGGNHVEYSEFKSVEDHYNWMHKQFPELFDNSYTRNHVIGYNSNADLDMIAKVISRRHSTFHFEHGFTLEDLGVQDFHIPKDINSIDELIKVYKDNKEIHDNLKEKIRAASTRDEAIVYEWVYNQLFTKDFDYNFYLLSNGTKSNDIGDVLKDRDYVLWNLYHNFMLEGSLETRQDGIREVIENIIDTLQYYINDPDLKYIFSFAATSSPGAMAHYIYLIVTFFKSYKVYFLDPSAAFIVDSKEDNTAGARYDAINELKLDFWKTDKFNARDVYAINYTIPVETDVRSPIIEVMDIYKYFVPMPGDDYDYDGLSANDEDLEYKDANGGIADDKKCIPFYVLNGGPGFGVIKDLWDINGSDAKEKKGYLMVDGGGSFHLDDIAVHFHCSHYHHYILDGGNDETDKFVRHSMHPKVIDNQDNLIVKVSNVQRDKLTQNDDESWTAQEYQSTWNRYGNLPMEDWYGNTSPGYFESYESVYNDLLDMIQIQSNKEINDHKLIFYTDIDQVCKPRNLSTYRTYEDSTYEDNGANHPYERLNPFRFGDEWNSLDDRVSYLELERIRNSEHIRANYEAIKKLRVWAVWGPFENYD